MYNWFHYNTKALLYARKTQKIVEFLRKEKSMQRGDLIDAINRMLDSADARQLDLIFRFVRGLVHGGGR